MRLLSILFLFALSISLLAQQTGSFQLNIDFNEPDYQENRNLYYYVPGDYDPNESYKLVVGFRGGPNSNAGQFRDQLDFFADSLNAIVLCPENADHFNNNEGQVKRLFQYSLDTTMSLYNIDEDFIYLTGLSYGGRHAVITAFDTDDGSIPPLRGVIPFATGSNGDAQPNYDSVAEFAPVCVCIGLSDSNNFINVANNLFNDMVTAGNEAFLNEIPNVGHTVAFSGFPNEMMECIQFIENSYTTSSDHHFIFNDDLDIFPNPVSNVLNIHQNLSKEIFQYQIVDIHGHVVKMDKLSGTQINVLDLSPGSYILHVSNEKRNYQTNFIKL